MTEPQPPDNGAEPGSGHGEEPRTRLPAAQPAHDAGGQAGAAEPGPDEPDGDEPTLSLAASGDESERATADESERATAEGPFGDSGTAEGGTVAPGTPAAAKPARKISATDVVIAVLVALLGFALVVQVRGSSIDSTLASARQDDLVRILSDLDSNEDRLRAEIADLEQLKRELTAGSESQQAAKQAAEKRADELGILAGTLPARGPGLQVRFSGTVRAARLLDAVEELRNAGAEAMQIAGSNGRVVRIVVSSSFTGPDNEVTVDGQKLIGPYTITVIGDPATMKTALNIPGGVVATVSSDGGNVIVDEPGTVRVTALASTPNLQYAQPAS